MYRGITQLVLRAGEQIVKRRSKVGDVNKFRVDLKNISHDYNLDINTRSIHLCSQLKSVIDVYMPFQNKTNV